MSEKINTIDVIEKQKHTTKECPKGRTGYNEDCYLCEYMEECVDE